MKKDEGFLYLRVTAPDARLPSEAERLEEKIREARARCPALAPVTRKDGRRIGTSRPVRLRPVSEG